MTKNKTIFNKSFVIGFLSYYLLMCGIDIAINNPIDWVTNLVISILGAVWFGYLEKKNNNIKT